MSLTKMLDEKFRKNLNFDGKIKKGGVVVKYFLTFYEINMAFQQHKSLLISILCNVINIDKISLLK